MTSRERVVTAMNFRPTDRLPKDLSGMRSTGVSAFAYQGLRNALKLSPKPTRVYDTWQMLAMPHIDVLDALGCDVVLVEDGLTNAFEQPEQWHDFDFNGRIPGAQVRGSADFRVDAEGILHHHNSTMPPTAHVFDEEHAGQHLVLEGELPRPDLKQVRRDLERDQLTDEQVKRFRDLCQRVRDESDRAVFLWGPLCLRLCIHGYGGLAVFPMLCLEDPAFIHELHSIHLDWAQRNARALLPELNGLVDIIGLDADDWGNQQSLMAGPATFRELFLPYRKQHAAELHRLAPKVKTFLHSCGAIYDLIDSMIDCGIDILNPVQWPAGGKTPQQWKQKAAGRLAFWGGGCNSQHTLPRGSIADIEREVREVVPVLAEGGGYVFANIHNLLAEVSPEKIVALYRACPC